MQILERTKEEIKRKAEKMSDFLRMEYLEECSKKVLENNVLRYCYVELIRLYEKKFMFSEAIKYTGKFQRVAISNKEKMQASLKEIELQIKGGFYDEVDASYKRALIYATALEKPGIKRAMIEFYKNEVSNFEKTGKNSKALKIYEKLVNLVSDDEKAEIKRRIWILYKKLGKVRETLELERAIRITPQPSQPYKTKYQHLSSHL